jgi:sulfur carrier protein
MQQGIEIELNGAPHRLPAERDLQTLIDTLALTGQALALAVNRQVVPRQQWRERLLMPHDKVDIVRAIGGG